MIDTHMQLTGTKAHFISEPEWFTQLRYDAFDHYQTAQPPRFAKVDYADWQLGEVTAQPKPFPNLFSQAPKSATSYIYCSLADALHTHEQLVKHYYLRRALTGLTDRLIAYTTAFVNSGSLLFIPAQTKLANPVKLVIQSTPEEEISHHLIILGKGAQATIQIQNQPQSRTHKVQRLCEIVLEADSRLTLINTDAFSANETVYLNRQAWVGENAHLNWTIGSFSDGNVIAEMNAELKGRRSKAQINNAAITSGTQIQGMNTRVTNFAPHSTGKIQQRGVILDESRLVFNGIGKIVHGAHGTIAQQENRILMLSDQASGDANPILLIDENDVEAGHAASVGRLDKKQLYYLMSRGLPKSVAKRLVVRGFISEVAQSVADKTIRSLFQQTIERKLPHD
ncbi:Fe-S cluster assembly protein SufD [Pediococcus siamensis]|uniref:Fe-S cluster assembly protein SufD n=1 Tax=Pediococcus siamensis TaxID=381829 RepID=UPI0039A01077